MISPHRQLIFALIQLILRILAFAQAAENSVLQLKTNRTILKVSLPQSKTPLGRMGCELWLQFRKAASSSAAIFVWWAAYYEIRQRIAPISWPTTGCEFQNFRQTAEYIASPVLPSGVQQTDSQGFAKTLANPGPWPPICVRITFRRKLLFEVFWWSSSRRQTIGQVIGKPAQGTSLELALLECYLESIFVG